MPSHYPFRISSILLGIGGADAPTGWRSGLGTLGLESGCAVATQFDGGCAGGGVGPGGGCVAFAILRDSV